jgi:hypothetical protein
MDNDPNLSKRTCWPEAGKEAAFELYTFHCGRSVAAVVTKLPEVIGESVDYQTVWNWQTRDGWDLQADSLLAGVMPNLQDRTAMALRVTGPDDAAYLQGVITGQERGDAQRIKACQIVFAAGGFEPYASNKDRSFSPGAAKPLAIDLDSAMLDELEAYERELRRTAYCKSPLRKTTERSTVE